MSVLLTVAIVTGGVSFCITSLGYMGIKFAKWSTENADAVEKRAIAEEKELEKAPQRELELEKQRKIEEEKTQRRIDVIADLMKQIKASPILYNKGEASACPYCTRESGEIVNDNKGTPIFRANARATGSTSWIQYVDACANAVQGEGQTRFVSDEAAKKHGPRRNSGPSSAITFNVNDKIYSIQICMSCGGWWRFSTK